MTHVNRFRHGVPAALLLLVLTPLAVLAQAGTSAITGRVTDPSGASVPGATVTATGNNQVVKVATTAVDGKYLFSWLPAGRYVVRMMAQGFALFERSDLDLAAGASRTLDARLEISVGRTEITVSDTATVSVDPSSNAGAIVLKEKDLAALSDNPEDLEADLQALAGPSAGPNGGQIYVDGFSGGRLPPKSSIREVRINQNPFSAEYDRLGFGRIEIFTKPGTDRFHGQAFVNFGDSIFNSRNSFAPDKPGYQTRMFEGNVSGPLTKKSSFFLELERRAATETAVVSALSLDSALNPTPVSQAILNPRTRTLFSPRIDYQLTPGNTLSARYSLMESSLNNGGVGELSLASRAYNSTTSEHTLQLTETAVLSPRVINEARFQFVRYRGDQDAVHSDPSLSVLGAFSGGGADIGLSRINTDRYELQNSTSITHGAHLFRFGGRVRGVTDSNYSTQGYNGAFTFTSLDAYRITLQGLADGLTPEQIRSAGGGASQFSISGGTPLASVRQRDLGLFAQDDWKLRPNFTLSLGLRYETQNNISDHLDFAPRAGFAWGIGGKGSQPRTVIRGGFGIFYDRISEDLTLQAFRLNGVNQQKMVVAFPDFFPAVPSIASLTASLVPSAIRKLDAGLQAPYVAQTAISIERQLPKNVSLSLTYAHSRGIHTLRSRNINAPLADQTRPFGNTGDVYLYESSGLFKQNQLIANVHARAGAKLTLFGFYMLGKAEGNSDGAGDFPANQYDLSSEWGRSGFDVRYRVAFGGSIAAPFGTRLSPFVTASSGRPFNITIGRDLNGDSLYNDRPAFATDLSRVSVVTTPYGVFDTKPVAGQTIISRNFGEGPGQFTVNLRLSKTFGFGGEQATAQAGAQPVGLSGPPPLGRGGPGGGGPRGGGRGGPGGMFGDSATGKRYSLTFSAAARNLLNNVNLAAPIGNLSSPLFGVSNAIAGGFGPEGSTTANRRIEFQLRFNF